MNNAQQLFLAYAQAPWRKQLQAIGLFSLGLVLIALVASLYLVVSAQVATYGREIQRIQVDIQDVQRSNADLQSQLAYISSAANIEARISELGLEPAQPDQIVYLKVDNYFSRQPADLAPPAAPAVAPAPSVTAEFSQPLFDWIKDQVLNIEFNQLISEVIKR